MQLRTNEEEDDEEEEEAAVGDDDDNDDEEAEGFGVGSLHSHSTISMPSVGTATNDCDLEPISAANKVVLPTPPCLKQQS